MKKIPPFKRLYNNLDYTKSGCWLWKGMTGSSGYGQIKAFGKMISCHRLSYELYKGQIPDDRDVCHTCDNPVCINPDHLFIANHKENMHDMINKGRKVIGKPSPRKGSESRQAKQVYALGSAYGSLKEAERELNLGSGTIAYWIKNIPYKARIITKQQYNMLTRHL